MVLKTWNSTTLAHECAIGFFLVHCRYIERRATVDMEESDLRAKRLPGAA